MNGLSKLLFQGELGKERPCSIVSVIFCRSLRNIIYHMYGIIFRNELVGRMSRNFLCAIESENVLDKENSSCVLTGFFLSFVCFLPRGQKTDDPKTQSSLSALISLSCTEFTMSQDHNSSFFSNHFSFNPPVQFMFRFIRGI